MAPKKFWGAVLTPNNVHLEPLDEPLHVSMATLDCSAMGADGDWCGNPVQVTLQYNSRCYLVCNLQKTSTTQVPLDLYVERGETVIFRCSASCVHLTGYTGGTN